MDRQPGCRQHQPGIRPAEQTANGACARMPEPPALAAARFPAALRAAGPGRAAPIPLQCGGGARGRRPHSRPARQPYAWWLIRPRAAGRHDGPPRAWAGDRKWRQRAAAAAIGASERQRQGSKRAGPAAFGHRSPPSRTRSTGRKPAGTGARGDQRRRRRSTPAATPSSSTHSADIAPPPPPLSATGSPLPSSAGACSAAATAAPASSMPAPHTEVVQ
jgi:hypothetical protein